MFIEQTKNIINKWSLKGALVSEKEETQKEDCFLLYC